MFIGLPIGDSKSFRPAIRPGAARRDERISIVAIEQQHHTLIAVRIAWQRGIVNQEANVGAIRIVVFDRKDDRLIGHITDTPCCMR